MTRWDRLITARKKLHLSQMEAAERVNVGIVTYQRWETGKAEPQPEHMRQLVAVFGALRASEAPDQKSISIEEKHSGESGEERDVPGAFITTHMTTHLWSLAFQHYPTCHDRQDAIRQAIKEFDTMNTDNKNYQITRREALCSLATLPMITFGLTISDKTVPSTHYGGVIAQCAASVEACWELGKSSEAGDVMLAFQSASKYLPALETIARNSSQHRKEALDLATRYALIKAFLGRHCVGSTEAIEYAKHAVALSKETGDTSLHLTAYNKLAWSYFFSKKDALALTTAQQAEALMQQYQHLPNTQPLHPCIQGGTHMALALMQAKNGRSPDAALGKATETDPGNESYAFMDFKRSNLLLDAGWTYCYAGDQAQAIAILQKRIDTETLAPRFPQSELGRVETINVLALSSLRAKDRDIEQTIHFWTAGIAGARTLQSEQRFLEALTIYELMDAIWPGEQRIADLRERIVHWQSIYHSQSVSDKQRYRE